MAAILEFEEKQLAPETRFTPSEVEIICRLLADGTSHLQAEITARDNLRARAFQLTAVPFGILMIITFALKIFFRDDIGIAGMLANHSLAVFVIGYLVINLVTLLGGGFEAIMGTRPKGQIAAKSGKLNRFLQIASQFEEHGRISRMQKLELDFRMAEAESVMAKASRIIGKAAYKS